MEENAAAVLCTKCGDRGIYVKGNVAYKCDCIKEYEKAKRYSQSRLPCKLQKNTFESFDLDYYPPDASKDRNGKSYREAALSVLKAAKDFAERNSVKTGGRGLFISGNVGSGKTFLCSAIANYLLDHGQEVLFLVVPDLLDEIRASYSGESDISEMQVLRQATSVPVLILDDLGAHNYTEWVSNKIFSIINNRLNNNASTVINSNLRLGEIEKYLGERTTSRIVELCDSHSLFSPKDIRHIKNLKRR